jgi:hypothetical protein
MQNDNRNRNDNRNDNRNRRPPATPTSAMKVVYVITRRNDRDHWTRIGVAFVNSDGSINVKLEAVPVNGEMHIRDYVAREDGDSSAG